MASRTRLLRSIPFLLVGACAPLGDDLGARSQALITATIWAEPRVLQYRTVVPGSEEHSENPTFTVFIELPDGSAASIDPATVTLNGVAALPSPTAVGDENGNGIPDLMVKFDRSVFEGNVEGLFEIAGAAAGGGFSGGSSVRICIVRGIDRSTYTLPFFTSNMPEGHLNGLPAELEVRRVRPLFGPSGGACEGEQSIIMVHGRTAEGFSVFDLDEEYSTQQALAERGIDTYAVNLLGFGRSRLVDELASTNLLNDACNASGPTCVLQPGEPVCTLAIMQARSCDCPGIPPSPNQQGALLIPNPLAATCPHTSYKPFQTTANQVADLDRVVDDVKLRTAGGRVSLLGYSAGGNTVGAYLDHPDRQAKIERAIFVAPLWNAITPPFPAYPLGVHSYNSISGGFALDPANCPGQKADDITHRVWAAIRLREPAPWKGWGPNPLTETGEPTATGGVARFPIVARSGFGPANAQRIWVPMLLLNGVLDLTGVPGGGKNSNLGVLRNSPQANPCTTSADCASGYVCETNLPAPQTPVCRLDNRVHVEIPCASHSIFWESCSGPSCFNPRLELQKLMGDYLLTGMVFPSP
jgi:alpha-beta hydrolase superfamily lysophospholipase